MQIIRFSSTDQTRRFRRFATPSLDEAFPPEEAKRLANRLEIHHTPKHGSRLNMAKIEFCALGRNLPERVADRPTMERCLGNVGAPAKQRDHQG